MMKWIEEFVLEEGNKQFYRIAHNNLDTCNISQLNLSMALGGGGPDGIWLKELIEQVKRAKANGWYLHDTVNEVCRTLKNITSSPSDTHCRNFVVPLVVRLCGVSLVWPATSANVHFATTPWHC